MENSLTLIQKLSFCFRKKEILEKEIVKFKTTGKYDADLLNSINVSVQPPKKSKLVVKYSMSN